MCGRISFCGLELFAINEEWLTNSKNTVCPNCYSHPYQRLLPYYLDNVCPEIKNCKVLIFSSEHCTEKYFRRHNIHYSTADLFDPSTDFHEDLQHTSFADESWDIIVCNQILEHIPDYKLGLSELRRIIKKGGFIAITVPVLPNSPITIEESKEDRENIDAKKLEKERIRLYGQHDHLRLFGEDFLKILEQSGFSVEILYGDDLPKIYRTVIGPFNTSDNRLFICRKTH
jgi:SAM-dependent methyltransferase